MSSREAAEAFVESLKALFDTDKIRMYPVSFDANLFDIDVRHNAWGITLSLDGRGESFRALLDDYSEIDGLSAPEALEFIAALIAGRAVVRVSKVPPFGRLVNLEVDLSSSRRLSAQRRWGSGLASWEETLLHP
jgi:hypothetical protein